MRQLRQRIITGGGILVLLALVYSAALGEQRLTEEDFYSDRYILILKSTKDYNEAVNFARDASKKLSIEFDNENTRYSKEEGIYYEGTDDPLYEGKYYPRRYTEEFISLENSGYYKGFADGFIIVVGGIYNDRKASKQALGKVKTVYHDAYIKKTKMWMGCIH